MYNFKFMLMDFLDNMENIKMIYFVMNFSGWWVIKFDEKFFFLKFMKYLLFNVLLWVENLFIECNDYVVKC